MATVVWRSRNSMWPRCGKCLNGRSELRDLVATLQECCVRAGEKKVAEPTHGSAPLCTIKRAAHAPAPAVGAPTSEWRMSLRSALDGNGIGRHKRPSCWTGCALSGADAVRRNDLSYCSLQLLGISRPSRISAWAARFCGFAFPGGISSEASVFEMVHRDAVPTAWE